MSRRKKEREREKLESTMQRFLSKKDDGLPMATSSGGDGFGSSSAPSGPIIKVRDYRLFIAPLTQRARNLLIAASLWLKLARRALCVFLFYDHLCCSDGCCQAKPFTIFTWVWFGLSVIFVVMGIKFASESAFVLIAVR